jgi:hypothetical protein
MPMSQPTQGTRAVESAVDFSAAIPAKRSGPRATPRHPALVEKNPHSRVLFFSIT